MAFELLETQHGGACYTSEDTPATFSVFVIKGKTLAMCITLHRSLLDKLNWAVGDKVQVLYDIGERKVMLRAGSSNAYKLCKQGGQAQVRRAIIHGAHNEPFKPVKMNAIAATSIKITDNNELILGVPEQE